MISGGIQGGLEVWVLLNKSDVTNSAYITAVFPPLSKSLGEDTKSPPIHLFLVVWIQNS